MKMLNIKLPVVVLGFVFCLYGSMANAYKVEIHSLLTEQAAKRSVLAEDGIWYDWGYDEGSIVQLPVETLIPESEVTWEGLLDNGRMNEDQKFRYFRLMAFGADVEDTDLNVTASVPSYLLPPPIRALYPNGVPSELLASRAYNHFFNPQVNQKLALVDIVQENYTSPTWILEDQGSIPEQERSYKDALNYFLRSFTQLEAVNRKSYLGKTIHTLGHVVHHIQDMAQPQHTRLDSHCDANPCQWFYSVIGDNDTSVYEVFTRDLISCGAFNFPNSAPQPLTCSSLAGSQWYSTWSTKTIQLNGYDIVNPAGFVDDPSNFYPRMLWTNSDKSGIANFSSRNFITTDTAYGFSDNCITASCDTFIDHLGPHSDDLPFPDGAGETLFNDGTSVRTYAGDEIFLKDLLSEDAESSFPVGYLNTKIRFVGLSFYDRYTDQRINNDRMASYSIFYERLNQVYVDPGSIYAPGSFSLTPRFTKNYFNLQEQAKILMPRAVGYSAGLINYFFRYRFEATFNEEDSRIEVRNTSPYEFRGELTFYYDDEAGNRRPIGPSFILTPSFSLIFEPGETHHYTVDMSSYPEDGSGQFIVVGNGRNSANLGRYMGVFGKVFNIPKPPPPIACGQTLSANGGTEGYSAAMQLGTESGIVAFSFEAFEIPDGFEIRAQSGETLLSSGGLISGFHESSFIHDGSADATIVDVSVFGNTDPATEWEMWVSCPEGTVDEDGNIIPELKIRIEHFIENDEPNGACVSQVWLDGNLVVDERNTTSEIFNKYIPIGFGTHTLVHATECGCDLAFGCGSELISGIYSLSHHPHDVEDLPGCSFAGCYEETIYVDRPGG